MCIYVGSYNPCMANHVKVLLLNCNGENTKLEYTQLTMGSRTWLHYLDHFSKAQSHIQKVSPVRMKTVVDAYAYMVIGAHVEAKTEVMGQDCWGVGKLQLTTLISGNLAFSGNKTSVAQRGNDGEGSYLPILFCLY